MLDNYFEDKVDVTYTVTYFVGHYIPNFIIFKYDYMFEMYAKKICDYIGILFIYLNGGFFFILNALPTACVPL